jgi:hypothetical protein
MFAKPSGTSPTTSGRPLGKRAISGTGGGLGLSAGAAVFFPPHPCPSADGRRRAIKRGRLARIMDLSQVA